MTYIFSRVLHQPSHIQQCCKKTNFKYFCIRIIYWFQAGSDHPARDRRRPSWCQTWCRHRRGSRPQRGHTRRSGAEKMFTFIANLDLNMEFLPWSHRSEAGRPWPAASRPWWRRCSPPPGWWCIGQSPGRNTHSWGHRDDMWHVTCNTWHPPGGDPVHGAAVCVHGEGGVDPLWVRNRRIPGSHPECFRHPDISRLKENLGNKGDGNKVRSH